jgi:hypothetical protein
MIPTCEDCNQEFLPREHDEWLVYERADARRPKYTFASIDQGGGKRRANMAVR